MHPLFSESTASGTGLTEASGKEDSTDCILASKLEKVKRAKKIKLGITDRSVQLQYLKKL